MHTGATSASRKSKENIRKILHSGTNFSVYKYALVIVDTATGYLMTAPLKTKTAQDVARTCMTMFWNGSMCPKILGCDRGSEFISKTFQSALESHGIQFQAIDRQNKNSNLSENSNKRITELFRRNLENSNDWTARLAKNTYCLNNSLMSYATKTYTPAYLFSKRANLSQIPQDLESDFSINQTIKEINNMRFKDHNSLLQAVNNRKTFIKDELILVMREHVIAAAGKSAKARKFKLESYYSLAKIISIINNDMVLVRLFNGQTRKVHKRQIKLVPQEQHEALSKAFEEKQSFLRK